MTDTTILDGTVDTVKAGLNDLSKDDLTALRDAEVAGKNRTGVLDAIDAALASAAVEADGASVEATASSIDTSPVADIPAATTFDPSGAPVQTTDIDLGHPAVDADPRAHTTEHQNRIDFNDPSFG